MYARKVSLCLKPESVSQFLEKVEHQVIPLRRKQKGYLDHFMLVSDSGKLFYLYSFWETNIRLHNPAGVRQTSHRSDRRGAACSRLRRLGRALVEWLVAAPRMNAVACNKHCNK